MKGGGGGRLMAGEAWRSREWRYNGVQDWGASDRQNRRQAGRQADWHAMILYIMNPSVVRLRFYRSIRIRPAFHISVKTGFCQCIRK